MLYCDNTPVSRLPYAWLVSWLFPLDSIGSYYEKVQNVITAFFYFSFLCTETFKVFRKYIESGALENIILFLFVCFSFLWHFHSPFQSKETFLYSWLFVTCSEKLPILTLQSKQSSNIDELTDSFVIIASHDYVTLLSNSQKPWSVHVTLVTTQLAINNLSSLLSSPPRLIQLSYITSYFTVGVVLSYNSSLLVYVHFASILSPVWASREKVWPNERVTRTWKDLH